MNTLVSCLRRDRFNYAKKISKYDLCGSCLRLKLQMSDGSFGYSIEEMIDGRGYANINPMEIYMINESIFTYLEEGGGCSKCIDIARRGLIEFTN